MTKLAKAYAAEPYSYAEARALSEDLALSEPVAIALVRRGYRTPKQARSFLEADESHPAAAFEPMGEISALLLEAIEGGRRITVHGDFDVDGVCATAIAVGAMRELGADCDWLIPDRLADGYGLTEAGVDALAERGTSLVVTVDCGITAVEAVARARERGMEVIVTDHHQPGPELPECPILHPALSRYPFTGLCGAAVAWKLTQGLREAAGGDPRDAEQDLDLVALATVADLVPLLGENRSLTRRGLELARRARRPGLRALIEAARCEASTLDEGDLGFRLAPRINAAGRLYRADAGVELFLTRDRQRAGAIAGELDRANRERRHTEREVEAAAGAALSELPDRLREAAAIVLAGPGWHPGVIGIVASRLAERHMRPAILISIDSEGHGRGSGRSVPGYDLLEGLRACSDQLQRFGGHRAAAGLEIAPDRVEAFRDAFVAHAAATIGPGHRVRTEQIDAVVGGDRIGLDLAEELERMGPFGMGNPGVSLLVPSARVRDVRGMGDGRHSRFNLHSGVNRALTVAFGRPSIPVAEDEAIDAAVRLEVNQWNGALEPRLVLREMYRLDGENGSGAGSEHRCELVAAEWWERFEAETAGATEAPVPAPPPGAAERERVRRRGSAAAIIAELVSSGDSVLVLSADASRRSRLAAGASGLARFGAGAPRIACGRCPREAIEALRHPRPGGLVLTDYAALGLVPDLPADHVHVVLVDPPPSAGLMGLAEAGGAGYLHPVWGEPEIAFAHSVLEEQCGLRLALRSLFVELREAAPCEGEALRAALCGRGEHPRSPELAARCASVLRELGLAEIEAGSGVWRLGAVSSDGTDLECSPAFRAWGARHEEGKRYLESLRDR
ncbi:MAG: single-stranded-DNA-specific exonuclease RecJ [Solirubrobacterales bacterium]